VTLEQARRLLTDPKYVRVLIGKAIEELTRRTWSEEEVTSQTLLKRKAIVQGLQIADGFFARAQAVVAGELAAAAEAEAERLEALLPPGAAAAMVEPVRRRKEG
jgi:hypothetical protein